MIVGSNMADPVLVLETVVGHSEGYYRLPISQ